MATKLLSMIFILVMGSLTKEHNEDEELEEIEEEQLCLKLHRLGRTCFRKVGKKIGG